MARHARGPLNAQDVLRACLAAALPHDGYILSGRADGGGQLVHAASRFNRTVQGGFFGHGGIMANGAKGVNYNFVGKHVDTRCGPPHYPVIQCERNDVGHEENY